VLSERARGPERITITALSAERPSCADCDASVNSDYVRSQNWATKNNKTNDNYVNANTQWELIN